MAAKRSQFIVVGNDLSVRVRMGVPEHGIGVSIRRRRSQDEEVIINGRPADSLAAGFRGTISDLESEDVFRETGQRIAFCLVPLDPWLIAVCAVMWEGIVQGLAWDGVKYSVERAIENLRGYGLAPGKGVTGQVKQKFVFESYVELGSLFRVFCRLEREFDRQEYSRPPSIEQPPLRQLNASSIGAPRTAPAESAKKRTTKKRTGTKKPIKKKSDVKRKKGL